MGNRPALLGDGVDVVGQRQRDHVGLSPSMTLRACLPEPPCDMLDGDLLAGLLCPMLGERRVEVLVEFAGRIVGDVEDLDAVGRAVDPPPGVGRLRTALDSSRCQASQRQVHRKRDGKLKLHRR